MPENEERSIDRLERELAAEISPIARAGQAVGLAAARVTAEHRAANPDVFKNQDQVIGRATAAPSPGYEHLQRILQQAYGQAAIGKGKERHSMSPVGFRPWHEQPILANARQVGPAGPAMQVMKKTQEAITMASNDNLEAAKHEMLGAIVYAAAVVKIIEEMIAARQA